MSLASGRDMDLSDLADLGLPVVTTVTFILQRPGAKSINFGLPKTDQKSICAAEAVAAAIRGRVHDKLDLKIKGPDNPTSQLLPKMSFNSFSRDGEGRKDKGGGERSRR